MIRRPRLSRRTAAASIAACFAALVAVPLALDRSLLATDPAAARSLVGAFGSMLAIVVLGLACRRALADGVGAASTVPPLVEDAPEGGGRDEVLVGERLRDHVRRAANLRSDGVASAAEESVWKEIRTAAAVAERRTANVSREEARERVAAGEWTDDRVAATFLASPEADVSYPARHVVYEWLTASGAFRRRAERAAEAVEKRYAAGELSPDAIEERLPSPRPTPADEAPDVATAVLGAELAAAIEGAAADGLLALPTDDGPVAREGLRAAAVAAVDRDSEVDSDARRAVRAGEWTDDPVAAAFLAGAAAGVDRPWLDTVRGVIDPAGALDRRVSRTASAVLSYCDSLSLDEGRNDAVSVDRTGAAAGAVERLDDPPEDDGEASEPEADSDEAEYRWPGDVGGPDDVANDERTTNPAPFLWNR